MPNVDRLLRWPEVEQITGICRFTARQLELQGDFPRRVTVGPRAVAWLSSEIQAFIQERAAQRSDPRAEATAKARRTPASKWRQIADAVSSPAAPVK